MAPPVYTNLAARDYVFRPARSDADTARLVLDFHKELPEYNETPLHPLPSLAAELGVAHVFAKDESHRFGLPSFKILGASWAVYRAVLARLGMPSSPPPSLGELGARAREAGVELVTCTEGNWGRAVARMGKYLGVTVKIFVPEFMIEETRARIRSEGAQVVVCEGGYDESVGEAKKEAERGGILVMDFGWDGFEEIPQVSLLAAHKALFFISSSSLPSSSSPDSRI